MNTFQNKTEWQSESGSPMHAGAALAYARNAPSGSSALRRLTLAAQKRSAQIVFDMHEFKLLLFIHALGYYVFGIKCKKRKCS